ncbi:MAG: vWA domain-containing protein [Nanobdellota archaeon]
MKRKKAIYYSMDALLAGFLLIGVVVALYHVSFYEQRIEQKNYLSQDVLTIFEELKIHELDNNSFVQIEIAGGGITNTNNTVLEQLGEYWATGFDYKAQRLLDSILNDTIKDIDNIRFNIGSDTIYEKFDSDPENLIAGRRMISGIAKGSPLTGYSSSAYLKKVRNKTTSKFSYFGGFYGQGNITTTMMLPDDYTDMKLVESILKLQTPGMFDVLINNNLCMDDMNGSGTTVDLWNITSCGNFLHAGENKITLVSSSELGDSYVSGGFLKVRYYTDTANEIFEPGYKRYYFPEIDGFVNIYDAIGAQGLIKNWTLNITFYNEYDTYFTMGNETHFIISGKNETQNVVYQKKDLSLPPTQIPIRLGATNLTNVTVDLEGQPADSFLVTDVSGSMDNCGEYYQYDELYCSYEYQYWFWWLYQECPYPGSCVSDECGGSSTTRNHEIFNKTVTTCNRTLLDLAKDADHLFVDTIFNDSYAHSIGLVDYSYDANSPTDLTSNDDLLHNEIETYSANGGTCTCCGINRARDLLINSTNNRFIVVLSDGEPTYYCSGLNDYTGSSGSSSLSRQWAIDAANEACDNNITVYSIGFGESMSEQGHDVMRQIACNETLYYNATNATELSSIYQNISSKVLVAANYTSQTINIVGNFSPSKLFAESYIDLYYDPIIDDPQSKIDLTYETPEFENCSTTFFIPEGMEVANAYVTSFSSNHWTKEVFANGIGIYNLTDYGEDYSILGDPFIIQIPSALLDSGQNNTISLTLGDSPYNNSNCTANNSVIYTGLVNSSTPRTGVVEYYEGCNWTIESETSTSNLLIPSDYNGTKHCFYTSLSTAYNETDAYDTAAAYLFEVFDPDKDGTISIDLSDSDLEITISLVSGVPYLWGPSVVTTNIWD